MRVKFPDGSGGPFLVPGVGLVNGGEVFDWPEDQPPVAGTVREDGSPVVAPAEDAAADGAGGDGGDGAGEDGSEDEAAPGRKASSGKGNAR